MGFVYKRIISEVKRAEYLTDLMPCIMLRDHLCNIIVLNVHAPTEYKSVGMKDSFEELKHVFH
jgi:hypothetical protein